MNDAQARLAYQDMQRRNEIVGEIEKLRPSDNPFIWIADVFIAVFVFFFLKNTINFDMTPETMMPIIFGVTISATLMVRENNRRTHKRIDALYKLMSTTSAEDTV